MEEVEFLVWPAVEEVAAPAPLKGVVALSLMEEAEAPLVEETLTLLKEVEELMPLS